MHRLEAIPALIQHLQARTYLEIGVEYGRVFLSIRARRKIGVDPCRQFYKSMFSRGLPGKLRRSIWSGTWRRLCGLETTRFFEMTSDEFFRRAPGLFARHTIDVALVDGEHTYEQAYRDVENCLRFLAPGGVIVMHDCRPMTAAQAVHAKSLQEAQRLNRADSDWNGWWCGDVWKAVLRLRTRRDLEVFVLDGDMGLGIVTRGTPDSVLSFSPEEIERLSYADLEKDCTALLNLKPGGYLYDFLKKHPRAGL